MEIDSKSKNARPVRRPELRGETSENSSEHVAGSPRRHPRIPCRIEVGIARRGGQDGMKTLQDDVRSPFPGRFQGDVQSPSLHILGRYTEQASHFARVRSQ